MAILDLTADEFDKYVKFVAGSIAKTNTLQKGFASVDLALSQINADKAFIVGLIGGNKIPSSVAADYKTKFMTAVSASQIAAQVNLIRSIANDDPALQAMVLCTDNGDGTYTPIS